jgi:hypothetical protein
MARLARVELVKDLVQEAVDRGAASVERIHQAIAALPFDVLEAVGVPDPLGLRERQRRVIGAVYAVVREANRQVGGMLSDAFESLEDGRRVADVLGADPVSGAARHSTAR